MATVKHAAQKSFAPVTTPWTVDFKWTKTTNYGLVNKYDVMPAGGMQVDDVIHDMSLNLSLDHVTNRGNGRAPIQRDAIQRDSIERQMRTAHQ